MAGLRIGVNALYLIPGQVGGTEVYLRSLLSAWGEMDDQNEYFLVTNRETGHALGPSSAGFHVLPQAVRAVNRPARLIWEQTALPVLAARMGFDVLFNPGFTAPALAPCPNVTVFHDLQHKRHPEHFRWWDLPAWRLFLFQSACLSETIVAVSEATRRDLLRYYPLSPKRIELIHHGVDEELRLIAARRRERSPEKLLLCVSTLHPHKNLDRLVLAFDSFRRQRPGFQLVLAGFRGFHACALERLIAELNLGEAVRLTGWISREELFDLYERAFACVYPSTFEGFGMPVLEALAAGVPAAVSDIPPLREVAADAVLLFNPANEAEIVSALVQLADDDQLRKRLAEEGSRRAAGFSWRAAAEKTRSVLVRSAR